MSRNIGLFTQTIYLRMVPAAPPEQTCSKKSVYLLTAKKKYEEVSRIFEKFNILDTSL